MRPKLATALFAVCLLAGCSVGVKRTPGMNLYSSGNFAAAIPLLEKEVAAGEVSARYPLASPIATDKAFSVMPSKQKCFLQAQRSAAIPAR